MEGGSIPTARCWGNVTPWQMYSSGAHSAALPAAGKLRFQPLSACFAMPRSQAFGSMRRSVSIDDAQSGVEIGGVFQPEIGATLIHGNLARPALQIQSGEPALNAFLSQKVDPVLANEKVRRAR